MNTEYTVSNFETIDTKLNIDLDVNLPQIIGTIALK